MVRVEESVDDHQRVYQYLCKGTANGEMPTVIMKNGIYFSDEFIMKYHGAYWAKNQELKNITRKRSRSIEPPMQDKILEECRSKGLRGHERLAICQLILREYKARSKPFNLFQVRSLCNIISLLLDDASERVLIELASDAARQI